MTEKKWRGREESQNMGKRTENKGDITSKHANKTLKQKACHLTTFDQLDRPTIKISAFRSDAA
jgi:hypothetical protein